MISSRRRELSLAISEERRSYSARVAWYSVEWWVWRSERSWAKSTFSAVMVVRGDWGLNLGIRTSVRYLLLFRLRNHRPCKILDTGDSRRKSKLEMQEKMASIVPVPLNPPSPPLAGCTGTIICLARYFVFPRSPLSSHLSSITSLRTFIIATACSSVKPSLCNRSTSLSVSKW